MPLVHFLLVSSLLRASFGFGGKVCPRCHLAGPALAKTRAGAFPTEFLVKASPLLARTRCERNEERREDDDPHPMKTSRKKRLHKHLLAHLLLCAVGFANVGNGRNRRTLGGQRNNGC